MDDNASEQDDLDFGVTNKGLAETQRVFDRFRVKGKLGRGGMGVVYRVFDETLGRDVALKFLPDIICADQAALHEIKRETSRGLELNHPNIVRIYDLVGGNQVGTDAAISMEYIDGDTLSAMRVDHPHHVFSSAEIAPWMQQLCDALSYAHTQAKIVHRDLKPANLMVNGAGQLKVTDFGIARSISDSVSRMSARVGDTAGTLVYMSPQQADGEKPSTLDDIYGVGAVIYELLTGKPPFHSGEIYQQVLNKIPPRMADRRWDLEVEAPDAIPESWERTVAACLSKDPGERPRSAAEIWEMLNAPPSVKTKSRQKATKAATAGTNRSRVPMVVAVALAVLGLTAAGWWFGVEQPRRAEVAASEHRQAVEDALTQTQQAIGAEDWAGASTLIDELASLDPQNGEIAGIRQQIADGLAARQQRIAVLIADAGKAIDGQDWDKAAGLTDELASLDPGSAEIAAIRLKISDGQEAERAEEEARQKRIGDTISEAEKALASRDWGKAEASASNLATLDPQNAKLSSIRQAIADGRKAERATAVPDDLPTSGFFTRPETFAKSPYSGYTEYATEQILRLAQAKLRDAGLYNSTIDGLPGSGTTDAIIAYQRANDPLEITGRLDTATLAALNLDGIVNKTAPATPVAGKQYFKDADW